MEIPDSTYDRLKRYTYLPLTIQFDGDDTAVGAAIMADVRAEGTDDVSLSCRFDNPMYGALAKKLGHALVISIGDEQVHARLHAVHPESVNVVAITVRVKQ